MLKWGTDPEVRFRGNGGYGNTALQGAAVLDKPGKYELVKVLLEHKEQIVALADALLVRETLDAHQVQRIAAGETLEAFVPAAGPTPASPQKPEATKEQERPAIVPPMSPAPIT